LSCDLQAFVEHGSRASPSTLSSCLAFGQRPHQRKCLAHRSITSAIRKRNHKDKRYECSSILLRFGVIMTDKHVALFSADFGHCWRFRHTRRQPPEVFDSSTGVVAVFLSLCTFCVALNRWPSLVFVPSEFSFVSCKSGSGSGFDTDVASLQQQHYLVVLFLQDSTQPEFRILLTLSDRRF